MQIIVAMVLSFWISSTSLFIHKFNKHCRQLNRQQKLVEDEK